ncbi:MAG: XdhC family protein [Acidobacteriaceae bacterium]
MAERRAIVAMWRKSQDGAAVLATLVGVEGSSYRRPGARMYIQSPAYAGSISGGCLEGEVVRKAAWLSRNGAAIERYSTIFDETAPDGSREIPYGLGCGGVLDLLLEPVSLPEAQASLAALEAAQQGATLASATLLPGEGRPSSAARVILRRTSSELPDEKWQPFFFSEELSFATHSVLTRLARNAVAAETVSITLDGQLRRVYVEPIAPPQRLVIFGAGDDARPLAEMARLLGWRVAIADGRAWLAQSARFPLAEQVLALRQGAENLGDLALTAQDAVALLTHSFDQDLHLLRRLLPLDLRYLGLLGARNRSHLLLNSVAQRLGWTPEACLQRVHAPIGLNLGGDSPEAVALTIVAEVQSVLHRKPALSLGMSLATLRADPAQPYIPVQCPLDQRPDQVSELTQANDVERNAR